MIQNLVDQLCALVGTQISKDTTAVLVDAHFAKASRQLDPGVTRYLFPVIDLFADEFAETSLRLYAPKSLIFMILTPISETIDSIKSHCLNAKPSSIYVFSNTLPSSSINDEKYLVDQLKESLGPVKASAVYLPLHTVPLLSQEALGYPFDLLELCAPVKNSFPLTLSRIGKTAHVRISDVRDVNAETIPAADKASFKRTAHELALSLVFELGLDANKSVYALGASSKLVAGTVQAELTNLADLRSQLQTHRGPSRIRDGASLLSDTLNLSCFRRLGLNRLLESRPLKSAALIIIDRYSLLVVFI
jgi:hypothetical protein